MRIETERLIIRSIEPGDEKIFAEMAEDGSLNDVGFDEHCSEWIGDWINEATLLSEKDDPRADYIAYFFEHYAEDEILSTISDANVPSWKTAEKAGFVLEDTRMYKDIYESEEQLYRFYAIKR
jgi:hypothetical protein